MLERAENNPGVEQFKSTVFNGVYVIRNVDQRYLYYLESLRNDASKALHAQTKVK